MSYKDGWAAINLQMPKRIPRTEYSAENHWSLISAVTGTKVSYDSDETIKAAARSSFLQKWNYDLFWNVLINGNVFGDVKTTMGHAEYADNGTDFSNKIQCPFKNPEEVLNFDPYKVYGTRDKKILKKSFDENYKSQCRLNPDGINMTGIYITCISGLIDIFGWDMLLLSAGTDPIGFGHLADRYCSWINQYFEALAEADIPVVMIHDDIVWTSGPFISPEWYREFIFPNYKKMFAPVIESGKKLLYTSDGTYTIFLDDLVECGAAGFVLEPTTDMQYIANKYGKTHVFVGNADTRILLNGSRQDIFNEVKRCIDIGKNCPGFFMAVGNHIPANTPVENAIYYNEVYEKLSKR